MDSSTNYLNQLIFIKQIYSELKRSQNLLAAKVISAEKHERKTRKFFEKLEETIHDVPNRKVPLTNSKIAPPAEFADEDDNNNTKFCGISCKPYSYSSTTIANDSGLNSPAEYQQDHSEETSVQKISPIKKVKIESWRIESKPVAFKTISLPSNSLEKKAIQLVVFLMNSSTANKNLLTKRAADQNLCHFVLKYASRLKFFNSASNLEKLIRRFDIVNYNNLLQLPTDAKYLHDKFVVLRNELLKRDLRKRLTVSLQKKRTYDGLLKYN